MEQGSVPKEGWAVRAWLKQQGFQKDDLRSEAKMMEGWRARPMMRACEMGELNVCKWLYDNGAAADVTRANRDGDTPMHYACKYGHLSVCQWLFKVGAAGDINKADIDNDTPMMLANNGGHLKVCRWLYEATGEKDDQMPNIMRTSDGANDVDNGVHGTNNGNGDTPSNEEMKSSEAPGGVRHGAGESTVASASAEEAKQVVAMEGLCPPPPWVLYESRSRSGRFYFLM